MNEANTEENKGNGRRERQTDRQTEEETERQRQRIILGVSMLWVELCSASPPNYV